MYTAYFEETPAPGRHEVAEVPWMVVPLVFSALVSLLLGIYPEPVLQLARMVAP